MKEGAQSEWLLTGDTKVKRRGVSLVSEKQVEEMTKRLEPGDVLLVRHEWFLSNIGLPGFWPHAVLFIGTPEDRKKYFDDADVKAWVQSQGWSVLGITASPITGPEGNVEFLLGAEKTGDS